MSSPVTEIAYTVLKPGLELEGSGSSARVLEETLTGVKEQEGFIRCYYGRTMEKEELLIFFVEWASHDSHMNFISAPHYGPFMDNFNTILISETTTHVNHIRPNPFPATILSRAPCIEFLTFYGIEPGFTANVEKFFASFDQFKIDGLVGYTWCEVLEDNVATHTEVLRGKKEGEGDGKALVVFIGWETREARVRYRETEGFKNNNYLLMEKCREAEMFHVSLKYV